MQNLKDQLRTEARALGFVDMRCVAADGSVESARFLDQFLADGRHGDMTWMETTAQRRRNPRAMWSDAKTAIVLSFSYTPEHDPLEALQHRRNATISVYAHGKDYHDIVKPKLKQLAGILQNKTGAEVKVFVDTAPLMEKPLAQRAGLGWQGKHTNLVSRNGGSWFFIGVILTEATLPPDDREDDHCGGCTRCLDVCPTDAFPEPYQLDARRCISYLTIEHKGHIAPEFRAAIGNRIYGCDDCLAVCPWNKFAAAANDMRLRARNQTDNPPLKDLLVMDEDAFRSRFRGTPVKRTGRSRMMRNILIAAGNSGDNSLVPHIVPLLSDPADVVRAMAIWALSRLMTHEQFEHYHTVHADYETDEAVAAEWQRALASYASISIGSDRANFSLN